MVTERASAPVGRLATLNSRYHKAGLTIFGLIVLGHWAEHIAQAIQIYVLGWPLPEARGVLGLPFPWLIKSEWMHYGYALLMLIGLIMLRPGFHGTAKTWWTASLLIQVWHHFEHLLLLTQAMTGWHLAGRPVPTSIIQLIVPRVELHLFYNTIVFIPMVVAMVRHLRPSPAERASMTCTCAQPALV
ncbi:hypothetical protein Sru01_12690 [Sphaerisporangium rufum]|uniref:Uncharacterized protein n=1 Tax=Sphaerisporangium rufum TaxID=1381558 RepID=A0A919UZG7_9ACTN|nr:hypothetical protein [Sphaerisporangium rufum]GII76287.1 hypothetical protein Sru01_12690 [Sphaerisporangium rufum]